MVLATSIADLPHRRFVAWGRIFAIASVVAIAVGALGWTTSDGAASADGPTASGTPTASVDVSDRFAPAEPMTAADWEQVDDSWDVFAVSMPNATNGPKERGALALYLTAPGGERRLAFARDDAEDSTLRAIAWDPQTMFMLLVNVVGEFWVADMRTGASTALAPPGGVSESMQSMGLGRGSDGRNYVAIYQGYNRNHLAVVSWDGSGWHGFVDLGDAGVGALSGDTTILARGGTMRTYDVVTGAQGPELLGVDDCYYASWATPTDFSAWCYAADELPVEVMGASITSGEPAEFLGSQRSELDLLTLGPYNIPGTPIVLGSAGDEVEVSILTIGGVHPVGRIPQADTPVFAVLEADSRWVLIGENQNTYVVDAERGTIENLGDGLKTVPAATSFLAGRRD